MNCARKPVIGGEVPVEENAEGAGVGAGCSSDTSKRREGRKGVLLKSEEVSAGPIGSS